MQKYSLKSKRIESRLFFSMVAMRDGDLTCVSLVASWFRRVPVLPYLRLFENEGSNVG